MKKAIKIVFFLIFAVAIGIYGYRNSVRASVVEYESELDANDYPKTLDRIKQIRRSLKGKSNAEKEREAEKMCPELYLIRHFIGSGRLVFDSVRSTLSANKGS